MSLTPSQFRRIIRSGVLLIGLLAALVLLIQPAGRNQAFRQALAAVLCQPADYQQALANLEPVLARDCRVYWQVSLLAQHDSDPLKLETGLEQMLYCGPDSVDRLFLIAPQRADLAQRAAQLYPLETTAWLWLGDLAKDAGDLPFAGQYYAESARLNPSEGLAWCRLGWVYAAQELLPEALDAFQRCCQNGDPGSNGCFGAGRMAEELGDVPAAIHYYRRSHWAPALERADELEGSQ